MARKDISGQKFGRLTAIKPVRSEKNLGVIWLCRCDCGGEKEVPVSRLTRGVTKSCGCLAKERAGHKDITGQRFGRLVAVSFRYYNEKNQDCWLFHCDCGNEKILPATDVKWGGTQSCGCLHREHIGNLKKQDITGIRFDRLVALHPTKKRDASGSIIWKCRCDCGNTAWYSANILRSGKVHSCGCLYKETRSTCHAFRHDVVGATNISALVASKAVRSDNTSGCTGVYQEKRYGHWIAYIDFQKHRYSLGTYSKKEHAMYVRKEAEKKLHDPAIQEHLCRLTKESKAKFLRYLKENPANNG